jgi:MFS family permease
MAHEPWKERASPTLNTTKLERRSSAGEISVPWVNRTFQSLGNPNFRLYVTAQVASNIGSWVQITAENWLVLRLGGSGLAIGVTNALQFGPLLFFGLYGGVVADRLDRRRLLMATQSALAMLAGAVGGLIATGLIRLWMVWVAALLLGFVMAFDKPALQAFVKELVGEVDLPNAVALNNAVVASGRMVGPVVSGLLIASFGLAPSFFLNAVSFGLVVVALIALDRKRLHSSKPSAPKPGQIREGLWSIRGDPVLLCTVAAMSAVFVAGYNFQVLVPLLASHSLGKSSAVYGTLMSCLGLGAVTGSLLMASWAKPGVAMIAGCSALLSAAYAWLAVPLGSITAFSDMVLLGIACGLFNVTVSSTLQLHARDDMRGRIMATYSIAILGSGLIGAPLIGMLADALGVRHTFLLIAAACLGTAAATTSAWSRLRHRGA